MAADRIPSGKGILGRLSRAQLPIKRLIFVGNRMPASTANTEFVARASQSMFRLSGGVTDRMSPKLMINDENHPILGRVLKMPVSLGGASGDIFTVPEIQRTIISRSDAYLSRSIEQYGRQKRSGFQDEDVSYFIGLARGLIEESHYQSDKDQHMSLCLKFDSPVVAEWVLNNFDLKQSFDVNRAQMMIVAKDPAEGLAEISPMEDLMIMGFNHEYQNKPFEDWQVIKRHIISWTSRGFSSQHFDIQPDSPKKQPLKLLRAVMRAILNPSDFLEYEVKHANTNRPLLDDKGNLVRKKYSEEQRSMMRRFFDILQQSHIVREIYDKLTCYRSDIPKEFPGGAQLVVVLPYNHKSSLEQHLTTSSGQNSPYAPEKK